MNNIDIFTKNTYLYIISLLYHTCIDSLDYQTFELVCQESFNATNIHIDNFIVDCGFVFEETTNFIIFDKLVVEEVYYQLRNDLNK